jgi:hypothetical protein
MTTMFIEIFTIALLIATICYAYTLNRRIQLIHKNRDELNILLNGFTSSLERAEVSVETLKTSGYEAIDILKTNLEEARTIRDDLRFLVDRGEEIANQLENGIRKKRETNNVKPFSQHMGPALEMPVSDDNQPEFCEPDDQVISEMKKKLIGRLRTLK